MLDGPNFEIWLLGNDLKFLGAIDKRLGRRVKNSKLKFISVVSVFPHFFHYAGGAFVSVQSIYSFQLQNSVVTYKNLPSSPPGPPPPPPPWLFVYIFSANFAAEFTASCFEAEGSYTTAIDPLATDYRLRNYGW